MKKILVSIIIISISVISISAFANGLLTNTNQSASYVRMIARNASLGIDATFYNPAGLTQVLRNGLHFSINNQTILQTRIIDNDLPILNNSRHEGSMVAPIFPSIYAVYKHDKWAFSFGFNPVAGGGKVDFKDGIPSLEMKIAVLPQTLTAAGIPTTAYSADIAFKGTSVYYGAQFNATYQINNMFSAALGARLLYALNSYKGQMANIKINPQHPILNPSGAMISASEFFKSAGMDSYVAATSDRFADLTQSGIGIAPIVGLNFKYNNLNIGARYEFRTRLETKNNTKIDGTGMFPDGKKQRVDVPSYFTIGASYQFLPNLNVALGFGYYGDKNAKMHSWNPEAVNPLDPTIPGDYVRRENFISKGSVEYSAGVEWNVTKRILVSAGYQYGRVGVKPEYQSDINHSINNHTYGFGGAYKVNENITINAGFLITHYIPYKVQMTNPDFTNTYDRRNKSISVGVDFSL